LNNLIKVEGEIDMMTAENDSFIRDFSVKLVNFIKNLSKNLEFLEEKIYKGYVFLCILGVE
jgi:hypothetical protein